MISIKIVGIFLASILSASFIVGMEGQSLEKMFPKDVWYCIVQYLAGDDAFLNRELVRHFSFTDAIYNKIVKAYLSKKRSFHPGSKEVTKIVEDNFTTAHGNSNLQQNMCNAFERYIEANPPNFFPSFDRKDLEKALASVAATEKAYSSPEGIETYVDIEDIL
jgi:hypothetical protein